MESSPPESSVVKAAFRKPSNDAASRNYRRRSPTDGSSSSDVDLELNHSSSPKHTREDPVKGHDYRERKKDDFEKDVPRDSNWIHHGKGSDSYKYSEHQSSRSSHSHSRHDEPKRRESDHKKSRDYMRDRDKYSRDKYESNSHSHKDREKEMSHLEHRKYKDKETHRSDSGRRKSYFEELERDRNDRDRDDRGGKREYHRSSQDRRSGWGKEESKRHHSESTAGKDLDGQKLVKEKRGFEDSNSVNDGDQFDRGLRKPLDDKSVSESNQNSTTKKARLFSSDGGPDMGKDDGGKQQSQDVNGGANSAQANVNVSGVANDLNAAKFAAMRAAELVNKNLAGGMGCMSTEQKKKLLWGNKKSTTTEESSRQWDVSHVADPERQEKFNKLMGVKGDGKSSEEKPGNEDGDSQIRAEKQKELQFNLEKQYTAGLRRRDGRTVGLGL